MRLMGIGYSTKCNLHCKHCFVDTAREYYDNCTMELDHALDLINEAHEADVKGIFFTVGEPLLFHDDIKILIARCNQHKILTRVVTNGYWASTPEEADTMVSELVEAGLNHIRISCDRFHQEEVPMANIVNAVDSCNKYRLLYNVSFVTDFTEQDKDIELELKSNSLKYNAESLIYYGAATKLDRPTAIYPASDNKCPIMIPVVWPNGKIFSCCGPGGYFRETEVFAPADLNNISLSKYYRDFETNPIIQSIIQIGLTTMANSLGMLSCDIAKLHRCELCEKIFNSPVKTKRITKIVMGSK